jgi:hypothetical protein
VTRQDGSDHLIRSDLLPRPRAPDSNRGSNGEHASTRDLVVAVELLAAEPGL